MSSSPAPPGAENLKTWNQPSVVQPTCPSVCGPRPAPLGLLALSKEQEPSGAPCPALGGVGTRRGRAMFPGPGPHLFLLAPTPFTTNEVTPSPSPQLKQAGVLGAAVLRTGLAQTAGFRFVTIRERGRELILRAVNTTRNPGVGTLPCGQGTV